jgi:RNA polymerase sigma factor for flagellar operon FliA
MKNVDIKNLWKKFEKDKSCKEEIVSHYLPLVRYVASKLVGRCGKFFEYEDLVGFGVIGLIESINKYDPKKNIKFETYAFLRIKGAILDALREQDLFTRSQREKLSKIENAYAKLERELGRDITEEELAKELEIDIKELEELLKEVSPFTLLSLDSERYLKYNNLEVSAEFISDKREKNPLEEIELKEIKKILEEEIEKLTPRQRDVLALYYYEDLTFKEISKVLEISEGRVSQIHTQAIIRLRKKLKNYLEEKK